MRVLRRGVRQSNDLRVPHHSLSLRSRFHHKILKINPVFHKNNNLFFYSAERENDPLRDRNLPFS